MTAIRTISPTTARRLAVAVQRLNVHSDNMLDTIRALGCVQLDPLSAVAKSHTLVLWSRLGKYDMAEFDRLLWKDRKLFEYWGHAASVVLTENYPLHQLQMRTTFTPTHHGKWLDWVQKNEPMREHIVKQLTERGALQFKEMDTEHLNPEGWKSTGWTDGYTVERMVDYLWIIGHLMVAHRRGTTRVWDLAERVLPEWTPREELSDHEVVRRATRIALRALGTATAKHIPYHFIRSHYFNLPVVLDELEAEKAIERVQIVEDGKAWAGGTWYVDAENLPLLESIERGEWQPRTTLLSPFDNLICDRPRTEKMFNFKFSIEIYVPKHKRQYGYYVLPILHGDTLIGRIDSAMNRKEKRYVINNVYAEPDAPMDEATGKAVAEAIRNLGDFLGAERVEIGENVPEGWRKGLV